MYFPELINQCCYFKIRRIIYLFKLEDKKYLIWPIKNIPFKFVFFIDIFEFQLAVKNSHYVNYQARYSE